MSDSGKKWYVVRAISGQENKVKAYVENEMLRLGLADFIGQLLVPTEKVFQIRNGKKVSKERHLRLVFILLNISIILSV